MGQQSDMKTITQHSKNDTQSVHAHAHTNDDVLSTSGSLLALNADNGMNTKAAYSSVLHIDTTQSESNVVDTLNSPGPATFLTNGALTEAFEYLSRSTTALAPSSPPAAASNSTSIHCKSSVSFSPGPGLAGSTTSLERQRPQTAAGPRGVLKKQMTVGHLLRDSSQKQVEPMHNSTTSSTGKRPKSAYMRPRKDSLHRRLKESIAAGGADPRTLQIRGRLPGGQQHLVTASVGAKLLVPFCTVFGINGSAIASYVTNSKGKLEKLSPTLRMPVQFDPVHPDAPVAYFVSASRMSSADVHLMSRSQLDIFRPSSAGILQVLVPPRRNDHNVYRVHWSIDNTDVDITKIPFGRRISRPKSPVSPVSPVSESDSTACKSPTSSRGLDSGGMEVQQDRINRKIRRIMQNIAAHIHKVVDIPQRVQLQALTVCMRQDDRGEMNVLWIESQEFSNDLRYHLLLDRHNTTHTDNILPSNRPKTAPARNSTVSVAQMLEAFSCPMCRRRVPSSVERFHVMLKTIIHEHEALEWAQQNCSPDEIDMRNCQISIPKWRYNPYKNQREFVLRIKKSADVYSSISKTLHEFELLNSTVYNVCCREGMDLPGFPVIPQDFTDQVSAAKPREHARGVIYYDRQRLNVDEWRRVKLEQYMQRVLRHPLLWPIVYKFLHPPAPKHKRNGKNHRLSATASRSSRARHPSLTRAMMFENGATSSPPTKEQKATMPKTLSFLFPTMSWQTYFEKRHNTLFLQRTIEVCRNCVRKMYSPHAGTVYDVLPIHVNMMKQQNSRPLLSSGFAPIKKSKRNNRYRKSMPVSQYTQKQRPHTAAYTRSAAVLASPVTDNDSSLGSNLSFDTDGSISGGVYQVPELKLRHEAVLSDTDSPTGDVTDNLEAMLLQLRKQRVEIQQVTRSTGSTAAAATTGNQAEQHKRTASGTNRSRPRRRPATAAPTRSRSKRSQAKQARSDSVSSPHTPVHKFWSRIPRRTKLSGTSSSNRRASMHRTVRM
jgi:hypothetical protein